MVDNETSQAVDHDSKWEAFKQSLLSGSPYLGLMLDPIEKRVRDTVLFKGKYPHALFIDHWDDYILDLSNSLERCLSYRREARELEIAAVRAAADYDQFCRSADISESLEIASLAIDSTRQKLTSVEKTLSSIDSNSESQTALSYYLGIERESLSSQISELDARQQLIRKKWEQLRDANASYHTRHEEKGNAHNFVERLSRVCELYADEIFECIAKQPFVRDGVSTIYGQKFEAPDYQDFEGYLDRSVEWLRDVSRYLSAMDEKETKFDLVIPLVQPWLGAQGRSLMNAEKFSDVMSNDNHIKQLTFEVDDVLFAMSNVRISGIGIAFGSETDSNKGESWRDIASGYRLRVTLRSPEQIDCDGNKYFRPPIIFGNVALHAADAPLAWSEGQAVKNLRPAGRWQMFIEARAVWLNGKEASIEEGWFTSVVPDIKLTFRICAILEEHSGSYFSK